MRRLLVVLLGCALVLAGCAQGGTKTRTLSSLPVPSTTVSPATVVAPTSDADLEKLMITDVPEGFKKQDDKSSSAGAFDLARAAKDDGQPEAAAILQSAGFVRSYKRVWLDSGNNQVIVFVYQFHDASGAAAYRMHVTDILKQNASDPLPFTVVGIPGADGVRQSVSNADAVTVTAATGPFLLLVACQAAKSDALPSLATTVARAQYARL
jgi:hypothetical protein